MSRPALGMASIKWGLSLAGASSRMPSPEGVRKAKQGRLRFSHHLPFHEGVTPYIVNSGLGEASFSRWPLASGGWRVRIICHAGSMSGPCAERGLQAAQLLSSFALVVAGHDQGGFPRPCEHCFHLRHAGALTQLRDEAAKRCLAEILCEARTFSGLYALQSFSARSFLLPILWGAA